MAQCINAGPGATSYGGGDDTVVNGGAGIDMGFAFPIGGTSYQYIHPCSNGFAYLSDGTPTYTNSDLSPSEADMYANEPRVAVMWDDMNLDAANGGDLLVDTSVAGQCTVTWNQIVPFGEPTPFNMQVTLYSSGEVVFAYDPGAYNDTPAIVGVSPGLGVATAPASVDLSAGVVTTDDMTHELIAGFDWDIDGATTVFAPQVPGFAVTSGSANCASLTTFGTGCISGHDAAYEHFAVGANDFVSGTVVSLSRTATGYTMTDSAPGSYVAPTAAATVISAVDDGFGAVTLSNAMPTLPGVTTTELVVCTNGFITLSGTEPTVSPNNYQATVAKLEAFVDPTICTWYDFRLPNGGQLVAEEVGDMMYITWEAAAAWNSTYLNTLQYQFNETTGDITIVFEDVLFDSDATWAESLVGFTPGAAQNAQSFDLSVDLAAGVNANFVPTLPLALDANAPVLGGNWDLTASNIDPFSPGALFFISTTPLPAGLDLTTVGINTPGCFAYIADIIRVDFVTGTGSATDSILMPSNPALAGAQLTVQATCGTTQNAFGMLTSNGVTGTLGN